jgi:hypothetical protein
MRLQMLAAGIERIEAVLVTHTHADHIFGMDDIRQFNFRHHMTMPIYGTAETLAHLRRVFDYCFQDTQAGGGKPQLALHEIRPAEPIELLGVPILPLTVLHGSLPVIAFKFGSRFAYVTDVSRIPDETRPHLRGLDTLVLGTGALRSASDALWPVSGAQRDRRSGPAPGVPHPPVAPLRSWGGERRAARRRRPGLRRLDARHPRCCCCGAGPVAEGEMA